jgi:MFS-type transporter involved in bile tolerance (Atg22 family)
MAVYASSLLFGVPVGALIQGKLATVFDLRIVMVASGVLLVVFAAYTVIRYHRLRVLDASADAAFSPLPVGDS